MNCCVDQIDGEVKKPPVYKVDPRIEVIKTGTTTRVITTCGVHVRSI